MLTRKTKYKIFSKLWFLLVWGGGGAGSGLVVQTLHRIKFTAW